MKIRSALLLFSLCALMPPNGAIASPATPFEETVSILENQTAFHWGRDCLVWIVHYPEALAEPWAEAEAQRRGMTESEKEAYEKGFISQLSLDTMEPFLFTVYSFGARPLSLAPISENVALLTERGERVKPVRYDRSLDGPLNGVVQGLVFFPKQKDGDFSLSVKGMGVSDENLFAFSPPSRDGYFDVLQVQDEDPDIVVVEIPPAKKSQPKKNRQNSAPPAVVSVTEPRPPINPPPAKEPEITIINDEPSQSMEDFIESMRPNRGSDKEIEEDKTPDNQILDENSYISREKTVRDFLDLWTKRDTNAMYAALSESSKKLLTREDFDAAIKKSSDFASAVKDGYSLRWDGTDKVRVVAYQRFILFRTMVARSFGVTRENSGWKIIW
ncbi:hypothetical protein AGMMS49957_03220 [Synergistales bacterium]|nr:hypothetical protein AGMMS49957_03220 [Synergistales bacterium]